LVFGRLVQFLQKSASVRAIAAAEEGQGLAGAAGPQPHAADPWRAGSRISLPVNFAKQEGNVKRT
jgi:hypothetical protein